MSKRDDYFFLQNIVEALEDIESYTADGFASFISEPMRQDAIERKFEILGEAVKNLSEDFRQKYPEIQWSHMARFRDILSHHYFGIDVRTVWDISQKDVKEALTQIVNLPEYVVAKQRFEEAWAKREKELDRLRRMKPEILSITEEYGIDKIYIFGSCARGEERPRSDIDILIGKQFQISLFDFAGLQSKLTELLGRKVDLCSENALKDDSFGQRVKKDLTEL